MTTSGNYEGGGFVVFAQPQPPPCNYDPPPTTTPLRQGGRSFRPARDRPPCNYDPLTPDLPRWPWPPTIPGSTFSRPGSQTLLKQMLLGRVGIFCVGLKNTAKQTFLGPAGDFWPHFSWPGSKTLQNQIVLRRPENCLVYFP